MDEANLPTDNFGRTIVLQGACLALQDVLLEVTGQGFTTTQVIALIEKKVEKIKGMIDE